MTIINEPSPLEVLVRGLQRGDRLEFPDELRELARKAVARKATYPTNPDDIRGWVERLAAEAAGMSD